MGSFYRPEREFRGVRGCDWELNAVGISHQTRYALELCGPTAKTLGSLRIGRQVRYSELAGRRRRTWNCFSRKSTILMVQTRSVIRPTESKISRGGRGSRAWWIWYVIRCKYRDWEQLTRSKKVCDFLHLNRQERADVGWRIRQSLGEGGGVAMCYTRRESRIERFNCSDLANT